MGPQGGDGIAQGGPELMDSRSMGSVLSLAQIWGA